MKKICLFICINILIFNSLQAQIKIGVGGGVHQASIGEKNNLQGWDINYKNYFSPLNGFHAGVFAEIPIGKKGNFAVLPSLQYTNKGREFAKSYDSTKSFNSDTSSILSSWKANYVELPVNLIYKLPLTKKVNFIIGAGGYVSYLLNSKTSYDIYNASGEHQSYNDKLTYGDQVKTYNKIDYGINAIAGFDFNDRILFTANYSKGLANFYNAGNGSTFKHQTVGAGVVVWLTRSKTAKVKATAKDSDGDGVPDKIDQCSGENGTAATNGCPDKDSDGIPDKEDKCAEIAGLSKYGGCPAPDQDKDGVPDEDDKCADVAGLAKYNGCPAPDTDNDGVNDEEDKCPGVAGLAKYNGCPAPDSDNDGINDEEDKCPSMAGTKDNNGCPAIAKNMIEEINKAAKSILFDVNSDNIKATSFIALDKIADIMLSNKALKLDIEGHTDNTGAVRHNQVLSGKRALAIKMYLVKKGVAHERMTASGFGSEHPIADNNTEAGRAKNRRVAFKVTY
ncbi:MAG: OmpA family protein [Chitinophagaceae bacterium]|nr:OmpA family protein [Chitinophagaceae bacterium]